MKKIRLMLTVLLLWLGSVGVAWADTDLGTITDNKGVTYNLFKYWDGRTEKYYALVYRIESDATMVDIPDKVTKPNGQEFTVWGFSMYFTCYCPNTTTLSIEESTYDGTFVGDFTGMPKLSEIRFYSKIDSGPSTNKSWMLDTSHTTFYGTTDLSVYLTEIVRATIQDPFTYYYAKDNISATWYSHNKIKKIYCTYRAKEEYSSSTHYGFTPISGNWDPLHDKVEATCVYIVPNQTIAYIPAYVEVIRNQLPQHWKITRLGYPGVTTVFNCPFLNTITFQGNIVIEQGVDFEKCTYLRKMVFDRDADLYAMTIPSGTNLQVVQMDFHGEATLCESLANLTSLKKVYFYGSIPTLPRGLKYLNDLTVYVDLDIYEIANWKASHSEWSNINMQPIDPNSCYRKVKVSNPGEGTFKVRKVHDRIETWETINPNSTKTIEVDKGASLEVKDLSIDELSNYRFCGIVFNETTCLYDEPGYFVLVAEKTNTLTAHYRQLTYPIGTQFDIHLSKVGDGVMEFRPDEENAWALVDEENNEWLELNDMSRDGEERDYSIAYYDGMDLDINFTCTYNKPVDGIVEQVVVFANGVPVDPWRTDDDADDVFCSYYTVHIDGNMDVQIVHKNNGRKFSIVNGAGGTIALYREGVTDPITNIGNGANYEKIEPKDIAHYAIITPNEGKEVFALFVNKPLSENARLQLDATQYLEEDGTYRVPLTGFEEGDDPYRLSVLYVDKPCYTFNLAVVGDGSLKCIPFRKEDGNIQAIREVTASESEGRNQLVKAYYDEVGETGYVEFYLTVPKEGETVKVYWDGVDVSNKFKFMENLGELRGVISSNPTQEQLGMLTSASVLAIYEEDADIITWKASMIGDTGSKASVIMMVDGGTAEIDLSTAALTGTATFDQSFIGTQLQLYVYVEPGKSAQLLFNGEDYTSLLTEDGMENGCLTYVIEADNLHQFFVDGTWTFCFSKTSDIIDFADAEVKRICVENWDTNGDGELSKAEAAAVTTLRKNNQAVFSNNQNITSFDELQYFTGLTGIDNSAFYMCKNLERVTLPEGITQIGNYAFLACKLTSINLPEGIESLGVYSFSQCNNLKHIRLPESLKTIRDNALRSWSNMRQLYIPKNVESIGVNCTASDLNLVSLAVDKDNTHFVTPGGSNVIIEKTSGKLLMGCSTSKIPSIVKTIGEGAFYNLKMEEIEIPSSVESIEKWAFMYCQQLKSVISKVVTPFEFGEDAFGNIGSNCVLTVPEGTKEAYIAAGWTTDIFKGGIVEAPEYDANGDGQTTIVDVTRLVDKIIGK